MADLIDIHHHLLHGLDDGAGSRAISNKMADLAEQQGVRAIIATPHAQPGLKPFDRETFEKRMMQLNAYCESCGYALRVLPGAEILYSEAALGSLERGEIPTMNGTRFVLLEWRPCADSELIFRSIREMSNAGYRPIIAHIERYPALRSELRRLETMKRTFDMRIQVDCAALLEGGHFLRRRWIRALMERELIDYVASDAHDDARRPLRMDQAYRYLEKNFGEGCARALTFENPRELIENRDQGVILP